MKAILLFLVLQKTQNIHCIYTQGKFLTENRVAKLAGRKVVTALL